MKRAILLSVAILGLGLGVFVMTRFASADDVLTDDQLATIKSQCTTLQSTLTQLHQNDTLLRIDRGQLYQTISDKLMVPLNQRIASNQLDGSTLVAMTASFNSQYQTFYKDYQQYDQDLSAVQAIDCTKQPSQFYSALETARADRQTVGNDTAKLNIIANQYGAAVLQFQKTVKVN